MFSWTLHLAALCNVAAATDDVWAALNSHVNRENDFYFLLRRFVRGRDNWQRGGLRLSLLDIKKSIENLKLASATHNNHLKADMQWIPRALLRNMKKKKMTLLYIHKQTTIYLNLLDNRSFVWELKSHHLASCRINWWISNFKRYVDCVTKHYLRCINQIKGDMICAAAVQLHDVLPSECFVCIASYIDALDLAILSEI
jgi:hypothetical protein